MQDSNNSGNKQAENNKGNTSGEIKKNILPKLSYPELDENGNQLIDENGNPKMREVAICDFKKLPYR